MSGPGEIFPSRPPPPTSRQACPYVIKHDRTRHVRYAHVAHLRFHGYDLLLLVLIMVHLGGLRQAPVAGGRYIFARPGNTVRRILDVRGSLVVFLHPEMSNNRERITPTVRSWCTGHATNL